jgi:hypothetical protein
MWAVVCIGGSVRRRTSSAYSNAHTHAHLLDRVRQHAHAVEVLVLLPLIGKVTLEVRGVRQSVLAEVVVGEHLAVE